MTDQPTDPSQIKPVPDLTHAEWIETTEDGTPGVEIAFVEDVVVMRDGKDPDGPVLVFTHAEWDAFVEGAKDGEFDEPWNWDTENDPTGAAGGGEGGDGTAGAGDARADTVSGHDGDR
ncbi:protein of unknown function (DUF397) [Streptoalloteichus tenebrarius]|uniref:DUF397 domain-containing protein n=1 Tax=Streptoalloteichus tenebrarius (strain ATCC 17920 / DSM 40477 / JCM 4838 / CBS 697.72 / NBRC 16177 / NCIMB 11028 / NRRL B-12390 / A12253. 1 / ISP 5477) TaxID=1933 RepID=A0ABT1HZQ8_STRSD|nr:DUF397 domain-containing protein [Streptoalloteichus tenebrarius]MCP2261013.1 protein of unknown function (DUF397) [Streptoalloteichus tenebrarius]BFF03196.1 hypothetical protein GCM10020241_48710 [Streptoalloteichus tenebrarius]